MRCLGSDERRDVDECVLEARVLSLGVDEEAMDLLLGPRLGAHVHLVYVKFMDDVDGVPTVPGWSVAGMENGVYCIAPKPEYWYLDAKTRGARMKIRRHQLPLAPDFARTIYSMQGFTLDAGKVDLNLDAYSDPVTGYVPLSRFRTADDVLILQPFDLAVFQQGVPDQPALLLQYLRTGNIDDGVRELKRKQAEAQQAKEATKQAARAESCKRNCAQENLEEGQRRKKSRKAVLQHKCSGPCGLMKGRTDFPAQAWRDRNKPGHRARCLECSDTQ